MPKSNFPCFPTYNGQLKYVVNGVELKPLWAIEKKPMPEGFKLPDLALPKLDGVNFKAPPPFQSRNETLEGRRERIRQRDLNHAYWRQDPAKLQQDFDRMFGGNKRPDLLDEQDDITSREQSLEILSSVRRGKQRERESDQDTFTTRSPTRHGNLFDVENPWDMETSINVEADIDYHPEADVEWEQFLYDEEQVYGSQAGPSSCRNQPKSSRRLSSRPDIFDIPMTPTPADPEAMSTITLAPTVRKSKRPAESDPEVDTVCGKKRLIERPMGKAIVELIERGKYGRRVWYYCRYRDEEEAAGDAVWQTSLKKNIETAQMIKDFEAAARRM